MGKVLKFRDRVIQKEFKLNEVETRFSSQLIVEIKDYRFELDEEFPWIRVFKITNDTIHELVDEIDILNEDYTCSVNTIEELKKISVKWYLCIGQNYTHIKF